VQLPAGVSGRYSSLTATRPHEAAKRHQGRETSARDRTGTMDAGRPLKGNWPMFCVKPNGDMAEVLIRAPVVAAPLKLNVKGPLSVFPL
jgi:hypothetical protein